MGIDTRACAAVVDSKSVTGPQVGTLRGAVGVSLAAAGNARMFLYSVACVDLAAVCSALLLVDALQVQDAAAVAGSAVYRTAGNRDIEHLLDELLSCVVRPEDVADVVTKLSATTFVQVCLGGRVGVWVWVCGCVLVLRWGRAGGKPGLYVVLGTCC